MNSPLIDARRIERILHFRSFPGLELVSTPALALMAENSIERFFPKGSFLHREGAPVDRIHWITKGRVELRRNGKPFSQFGAKESALGLAAVARQKNGPEAIAIEDTWSIELDNTEMDEVFADNFDLLWVALRNIAHQFVELRKALGPTAGFLQTPDRGESPLGGILDKALFLGGTSALEGAPLTALFDLLRQSRERFFQPSDPIWRLGDRSDRILVILRGRIVGTNKFQNFSFHPGEWVGEIECFGQDSRWYSAKSEGEVHAIELNLESLIDLMEDNPGVGVTILTRLAGSMLNFIEAQAA